MLYIFHKGAGRMFITIKRNTGWYGMGSRIQIEIDGKRIASIAENQKREIGIPNKKASLRVTQYGIKSNTIEVFDGDLIEIISTKWYRMSFPLIIAGMVLSAFIPALMFRIIAIASIGILIFISLYLLNGFNLKVMGKGR